MGQSFPWVSGILQEIHKGIQQNSKTTYPAHQTTKFDWAPTHHAAFLQLKEAIVQAPILHYPNPTKKYIVYTDASDDACRVQLSQEHNGTEFPVAFCHIPLQKHNANGAPQNRKPLVYIMPSLNGIITYKELTSLSGMTINP